MRSEEEMNHIRYGGAPDEMVTIRQTRAYWVGMLGTIGVARMEACSVEEAASYDEDAAVIDQALGLPSVIEDEDPL